MYEFIRYVLWELKNSLGLVFLAGIGASAVLAAVYSFHKKKYRGERKFPWGKTLLWLTFIGYMTIVIYATMLRGGGVFRRDWNLHLFRAWREAWNNYSVKNWANVLLNVALFGPFGFLLPLLGKRFRKWYLTVPAGFGLSLGIELLQLAIGRGVCDVDDLFANTLGTVMGYLLIMAVLSVVGQKEKRWKPCLGYGAALLASIMAVCSIFIAYEAKEYGNLPMAAAYTNDTRNTVWTLACELPETNEKAAVYRTQTLSTAACDALAAELAKISGQEVLMVSYYQEFAYYNLSRGILSVYYHDGSFEFSGGYSHEEGWTETDRETLVKALENYPVSIPDSAEFLVEEDGWHSFTCRRYADGAVMIDGTLRCRYATDGTVRVIENHLVWYTFYKDTGIITPQEAYELLRAGEFYDGGYFEYKDPREVSVTGCTLAYEIDTKGFYQPVYYFDVASKDGSYQDRIMIPAMQ